MLESYSVMFQSTIVSLVACTSLQGLSKVSCLETTGVCLHGLKADVFVAVSTSPISACGKVSSNFVTEDELLSTTSVMVITTKTAYVLVTSRWCFET